MIKGSAGQEKLTSAFWLSNVTNRQMNLGGSVEGSFSTSPVLTFLKLISLLLNFHKKSIVLETFKTVFLSVYKNPDNNCQDFFLEIVRIFLEK